jgi:tetratricopeptide (TPR) repeat protein
MQGKGVLMDTCKLNRFFLWIVIVLVFLFNTDCVSSDYASIEEKLETVKTYPYSEPDPVPILARSGLWGRGARLYPYFFFDKFSKTSVLQDWKVIRMENPYISVSVLPEMGGKVWGAAEKSTGNEFIYTNHVMKFREIALRGPWTSGGIEFNFGIVGHAPSTATPVDYWMRENTDGSVSCVVGSLDLPSRTRWSMTIHLPKDKAYFETRAFWYNPSPFHQSYYAWMNAAVRAADDLQYIFPGLHHIGHNYDVPLQPWPVDEEGRDLSWYKNNDFGSYKSYFTVGEYENFFGGYWHDAKFGFGHWALYDDVPGHKLWIWGLSRQGMVWENLLTDEDGQYSEPQAGRYFNQSDHALFLPYTADNWREIWFPYKDIGPMVKASPLGVLNVEQKKGQDEVKIGLFPLQRIEESLVVMYGGNEIYRELLFLNPAQIYEKTLSVDSSENKLLKIQVGNRLFYSSDPEANDIERPIRFHPYNAETAEGRYLLGKQREKERNYYSALENYLLCLEKEPLHTRALSRVAELYCRRGEYETAKFYAHRALLNEMYDPEANYICGIISRRLGNLIDAKETLGWAARSLQYRSSAYAQIAEIYFQENNYEFSLNYIRRALNYNNYNINALLLESAIYRMQSRPYRAQEVLRKILAMDPLNHLARYELYLTEPTPGNLENFHSMIQNELPNETYMEMALHYVNLGLIPQAIPLFEYIPQYPTSRYWISYLFREEDPAKSLANLDEAQKLSPWLVFPFREESIPVFRWASQSIPDDWKAKYYLALILWSKGRVTEARDCFDACGSMPDFAPFYLARGHFYKSIDLQQAQIDFEKAVEVDAQSWKTWHTLIGFYAEQSFPEKALETAVEANRRFPEEDCLKVDLVRTFIGNDRNEEAADILENLTILPSEGATGVHELFVRCHVNLGLEKIQERNYEQALRHLEKAKTYPESLGSGQPYESDQRMQDYLIAYCYDKSGEREKSMELKKAIYDYTIEHMSSQGENQYFGGLALIDLGERRLGRELLRKNRLPEDFLLKIRTIIR